MDRKIVHVIKGGGKNVPSAPRDKETLFTQCTAEGVRIPIVNDDKTVILLYNDSFFDAEVTVKHGNGVQGVNDLVIPVPVLSYVAVSIESGRFKRIYGEDAGYVIVEGDVKLAVFESV